MFIAIEGIDGSGGETQSKLLFNYLKKKGKKVELISYPDYQNEIGKLLKKFLKEKVDLSVDMQFLLFASDMVKDRDKIKELLKGGYFIIANRYFLSTLAYQCTKGFKLKKALEFAKNFGIIKPSLVILLDISEITSIKRKYKEVKNLDRHERDLEFLRKVRKKYLWLAKNKVFCKKWIIIDGEKSIEEVHKEIIKRLKI